MGKIKKEIRAIDNEGIVFSAQYKIDEIINFNFNVYKTKISLETGFNVLLGKIALLYELDIINYCGFEDMLNAIEEKYIKRLREIKEQK